jgi:hypothetical protein
MGYGLVTFNKAHILRLLNPNASRCGQCLEGTVGTPKHPMNMTAVLVCKLGMSVNDSYPNHPKSRILCFPSTSVSLYG